MGPADIIDRIWGSDDMEYALVNGHRIRATPKSVGECQICERPVISKCGTQNIWHWAHKVKQGCDPWWENEGAWHRAWKSNFPDEMHEVVAYDASGEKHIADLKLADGLVVELQHSAMSIAEMRSREMFYDRMIWIVDAEPFKKNITLFDPLPDPKLSFVDDLVFVSPDPLWRYNGMVRGMNYKTLVFFRRSKESGHSMKLIESGDEIEEDFVSTYVGHHLFLWMKPREIWYQATRPVFLDFGDGRIGRLMRYRADQRLWCIKFRSKESLVSHLLTRLDEAL